MYRKHHRYSQCRAHRISRQEQMVRVMSTFGVLLLAAGLLTTLTFIHL